MTEAFPCNKQVIFFWKVSNCPIFSKKYCICRAKGWQFFNCLAPLHLKKNYTYTCLFGREIADYQSFFDPGWLWITKSDSGWLENCFRCFLSILHTRPFDASHRKGWDKSLINFTLPTTLQLNNLPKKITPKSSDAQLIVAKIDASASANQIPSYFLASLLLVFLWSGQTGVPQCNTNTKVPSLCGQYFRIFLMSWHSQKVSEMKILNT